MDLLYDFAQPYSIGLICDWLGVPAGDHRDLLDWSHAMVKMYELDTPRSRRSRQTRRRPRSATSRSS